MNDHPFPPWLLATFPFLFILMWVLALTTLSRIGGWRRLAETYGLHAGTVQGSRFRFRSGSFGSISYNGVLMIDAGPQGLAFAVFLPFRAGHSPFSVPWSDISFARRKRWFMSLVELSFARAPDVVVTLPSGLAESLATAGGVAHRIAPGG